MSVHAFVDESARGQTYIVCAAIVEPAQLRPVRQRLRGLLLPGQRELHFHGEKPARRRALADHIGRLPVSARLYTAPCTPKTEEDARQRCLAQLVAYLLDIGGHRLVIDSRSHRDARDLATVYRTLNAHRSQTHLSYEHLDSVSEPLLWVADATAWCWGRRGDAWQRIRSIASAVVDV